MDREGEGKRERESAGDRVQLYVLYSIIKYCDVYVMCCNVHIMYSAGGTPNVHVLYSNVYVMYSNVYITYSDVYIMYSDVYIMYSNVYVMYSDVYVLF